MNHLLFIDEVSGLPDESHEGGEVVGPIIQYLAGILALPEAHQTSRSVYTGIDGLLGHQLRQEVLRFL